VTLNFEKLSLEDGLRRLLRNQNSAFTYSEKKEEPSEKTRYVLSHVIVLEKSTSIQERIRQRPEITGEVHASPSSQVPKSNTVAEERIKELLIQKLSEQEKALKTLMEGTNFEKEPVNYQIEKVLKQFRKLENKNLGVEAIEKILRGGELEKIGPMSPK
jgi:hypothetical protein